MGAAAQDGAPAPDRRWEYDPPGDGGTINDVSIDAAGTLLAAVQSDVSAADGGDNELFVWDLSRSGNSSNPTLSHDPSPQLLTDPEGLGVVAVEPGRERSADLVAVGNEGDDGNNANNEIYVYRVSRGPESVQSATYPGEDRSAPDGAVEDLWFLDGETLLAWHDNDALSLLKQESGPHFQEKGKSDARWSPDAGSIVDVDVSQDGDRIAVATMQGVSDNTLGLHVLEPQGNNLVEVTNPETRQRNSNEAVVAISGDGEYVAAGTGDSALFYYNIVPTNETDDDRDWNFSEPWSFQAPGSVTALGLSADGTVFAAGFGSNEVLVFEQTALEDDGPLAARAVDASFSTTGTPTQVTFSNDGERLFVLAGALYGFNDRQFDTSKDLKALWAVSRVRLAAFGDTGDTFVGASQSTVSAFDQSYRANVTIEAPDTATPGKALTVDVTIRNTGSSFDTFAVETEDVPSDWSVVTDPTELELLPGKKGTVQLNLTPHEAQTAGDITFTVQAESQRSPSQAVAGEREVTLTIEEVRRVDLSTPAQDQVEATRGETSTIPIDVKNAGNVDGTIEIEVDQDADWPVSIGNESGASRTVELAAQDSNRYIVNIDVPDAVAEGSSNQLTITARHQEGGPTSEIQVELLVEPSYGVSLSGPTTVQEVQPGDQTTFTVTVSNAGNTPDTISLKTFSNASNPEHLWRAELDPNTLEIDADGQSQTQVTVTVPRGAEPGESADVTVAARSQATGIQEATATFQLQVAEETDGAPLPVLLVPLGLGAAALVRGRRD